MFKFRNAFVKVVVVSSFCAIFCLYFLLISGEWLPFYYKVYCFSIFEQAELLTSFHKISVKSKTLWNKDSKTEQILMYKIPDVWNEFLSQFAVRSFMFVSECCCDTNKTRKLYRSGAACQRIGHNCLINTSKQ